MPVPTMPRRCSARRFTICTARSAPAWCAFAGYEMPVQYPAGIIAEHLHTRAKAGLFDVSHMGQMRLAGADPRGGAWRRWCRATSAGSAPGRMRYTLLLNDAGGILDDLMVDAARRRAVRSSSTPRARTPISRICATHLGRARRGRAARSTAPCWRCRGRRAAAVLARLAAGVERMPFMTAAQADARRRSLLRHPLGLYRRGRVRDFGAGVGRAARWPSGCWPSRRSTPIGLGARDTLRLEAGLCLYGHDIDETTTPVEAGLAWTIGKRRRARGRLSGRRDHLARSSPRGRARKRVGIRPDGRAPAREGTAITRSRPARRSAG